MGNNKVYKNAGRMRLYSTGVFVQSCLVEKKTRYDILSLHHTRTIYNEAACTAYNGLQKVGGDVEQSDSNDAIQQTNQSINQSIRLSASRVLITHTTPFNRSNHLFVIARHQNCGIESERLKAACPRVVIDAMLRMCRVSALRA